jgi:hypothetical protein
VHMETIPSDHTLNCSGALRMKLTKCISRSPGPAFSLSSKRRRRPSWRIARW